MPKSKIRKKNGRKVSGVKRPRIRRKNLEKRMEEMGEAYDLLLEAEEEYIRRYGEEMPSTEDEENQDAD